MLAVKLSFTRKRTLACVGLFSLLQSACMTPPVIEDNPLSDTDGPGVEHRILTGGEQVRNLPKSRYGNMTSYEINGIEYKVMDTAANYSERGVASWYGTKFHGRKTSSGEIYDMYAMTAAHKHLPVPTFVSVRNLENGREVVVKVNDRGPFVDNRVIDLSYAAAQRLGMLDKGTANVIVTALTTHETVMEDAQQLEADLNTPVTTALVEASRATAQQQPVRSPLVATAAQNPSSEWTDAPDYYIQLGAFSSVPNAELLVSHLSTRVSPAAFIESDPVKSLFRVKMGPFRNGEAVEEALTTLSSAGISAIPSVITSH